MSPTRRRPHPASAARIVAAGLSSATAFGLVAAMGVAGQPGGSVPPAVPAADRAPVASPAPAALTPLVIRRYWLQSPSGAVTPLTDAPSNTTGIGSLAASPAPATRATPATPAPRPVTRSHGS